MPLFLRICFILFFFKLSTGRGFCGYKPRAIYNLNFKQHTGNHLVNSARPEQSRVLKHRATFASIFQILNIRQLQCEVFSLYPQ